MRTSTSRRRLVAGLAGSLAAAAATVALVGAPTAADVRGHGLKAPQLGGHGLSLSAGHGLR